MTDSDRGWDALTEAWQQEEPGPFEVDDIKSVLGARRRLTWMVVLGELMVTAGLIGVTVWLSGPATVGADTLFLVGAWLFWGLATGFAWWNRRGQWRLSVASPEDFVRLSLERAERKIRVAWFSAGLLVAQVAFVVALSLGRDSPAQGLGSMLSTLAIVVAAYSGWTVWYYRRARHEREHFAAVLRSMEAARQEEPASELGIGPDEQGQ